MSQKYSMGLAISSFEELVTLLETNDVVFWDDHVTSRVFIEHMRYNTLKQAIERGRICIAESLEPKPKPLG